jgi:hypothetical protein
MLIEKEKNRVQRAIVSNIRVNCSLTRFVLNPKGLVISAVIMLLGCSGSTVKEEGSANVTSSPSGAEVYANGEKLGVTPLYYKLHKAFPAGWKNMMYQAQGVLMVKMDGCEDFKLQVNDYVLSNPIHAELVCSDKITPEEKSTANQEVKSPVGEPVASPQSEIENRLNELEDLYERGLITREEYSETRKRILNEI